jgi:hypothetical protein
VLAWLRTAFASWRRRRYLKRHPEPHRDHSIPWRRSAADGTGFMAFMPPPSRPVYRAPPRPRRRDDDDEPPKAGGGGHHVSPPARARPRVASSPA